MARDFLAQKLQPPSWDDSLIVLKPTDVAIEGQLRPPKNQRKKWREKNVFLPFIYFIFYCNLVFSWVGWPWVVTSVGFNVICTVFPTQQRLEIVNILLDTPFADLLVSGFDGA